MRNSVAAFATDPLTVSDPGHWMALRAGQHPPCITWWGGPGLQTWVGDILAPIPVPITYDFIISNDGSGGAS